MYIILYIHTHRSPLRGLSLAAASRVYSPVLECRHLIVVTSVVADHGLQGARVQ